MSALGHKRTAATSGCWRDNVYVMPPQKLFHSPTGTMSLRSVFFNPRDPGWVENEQSQARHLERKSLDDMRLRMTAFDRLC